MREDSVSTFSYCFILHSAQNLAPVSIFTPVLAEFFGCQRLAALGQNFPLLTRTTMRAGGHNSLCELIGRDIIHGLGFFTGVVDGRLDLNGGVFLFQDRSAILAHAACPVPAVIVHPVTTALALVEKRRRLRRQLRRHYRGLFQPAERTFQRIRALPKTPPKRLLAASRALVTVPNVEAWNSVWYPLPQRSQANSN
jgi:hypothetical protein